jgi:hypothetical protein
VGVGRPDTLHQVVGSMPQPPVTKPALVASTDAGFLLPCLSGDRPVARPKCRTDTKRHTADCRQISDLF